MRLKLENGRKAEIVNVGNRFRPEYLAYCRKPELYARGKTVESAKAALTSMINDALKGKDSQSADQAQA